MCHRLDRVRQTGFPSERLTIQRSRLLPWPRSNTMSVSEGHCIMNWLASRVMIDLAVNHRSGPSRTDQLRRCHLAVSQTQRGSRRARTRRCGTSSARRAGSTSMPTTSSTWRTLLPIRPRIRDGSRGSASVTRLRDGSRLSSRVRIRRMKAGRRRRSCRRCRGQRIRSANPDREGCAPPPCASEVHPDQTMGGCAPVRASPASVCCMLERLRESIHDPSIRPLPTPNDFLALLGSGH